MAPLFGVGPLELAVALLGGGRGCGGAARLERVDGERRLGGPDDAELACTAAAAAAAAAAASFNAGSPHPFGIRGWRCGAGSVLVRGAPGHGLGPAGAGSGRARTVDGEGAEVDVDVVVGRRRVDDEVHRACSARTP